jgi:hypothetical protein
MRRSPLAVGIKFGLLLPPIQTVESMPVVRSEKRRPNVAP